MWLNGSWHARVALIRAKALNASVEKWTIKIPLQVEVCQTNLVAVNDAKRLQSSHIMNTYFAETMTQNLFNIDSSTSKSWDHLHLFHFTSVFFTRQRAVKEDSLEFISRFSIQPRDLWCGSEDYGSGSTSFFLQGFAVEGSQLFHLQCFWPCVQSSLCAHIISYFVYNVIECIYTFVSIDFLDKYLDYISCAFGRG